MPLSTPGVDHLRSYGTVLNPPFSFQGIIQSEVAYFASLGVGHDSPLCFGESEDVLHCDPLPLTRSVEPSSPGTTSRALVSSGSTSP